MKAQMREGTEKIEKDRTTEEETKRHREIRVRYGTVSHVLKIVSKAPRDLGT